MSRKQRAIELMKDILIVALACSAIWMAARIQLWGLEKEEKVPLSAGKTQSEGRAEAARPLRMTANLPGGAERYGVLYDAAACDALFQQVAGLFVEALSSAREPEKITPRQWRAALAAAPGIFLDFQGEMPLGVLSVWLSGGETALDVQVRRLGLAPWQEGAALFYQSGEEYFRCAAPVVNLLHMEEAVASLTGNGAFYAFESELYPALDPDTLLPGETPAPAVFAVSNPVSGGQSALEKLAGELGFPVNANGIYYAGEWVARSGSDTLRLSDRGSLVYLSGGESEGFPVAGLGGSARTDAAEACRQLAAAVLGPRCGQARLYLMGVESSGEGWEVTFGYSLEGIPVRLEGAAARFLVQNGRITQFTLQARCYTAAGESSVLLPARQAAAAQEAMGLAGEELLLVYSDSGGDTVSAGWAASREGGS